MALRREATERVRLARHPDLTYLFWECTLRCNLRCLHCGSSCETRSPLPELSAGQVCAILDTIAADFDASRIFVSITGGEPLLRSDLATVVAHMSRLGLRSCIVTNGVLLSERRAAELVEAGMRTVTVSVDGLAPRHDAVRGEGSYAKALAGLHNAKRAGMTTVEAITCVRPANLADLATLEHVVNEAGADLWRLITIDRMGRLAGAERRTCGSSRPKSATCSTSSRRDARAAPTCAFRAAAFWASDASAGCGLSMASASPASPSPPSCATARWAPAPRCRGPGRRKAPPSTERFSTLWRERFAPYRDLSSAAPGPVPGLLLV